VTTAGDVVAGVDLRGRTCMVTGATSGLGFEAAAALAAAGADVVVAGRTDAAAAGAAAAIRERVPRARLRPVPLDLASLASVRAAAEAVARLTPVLDVLMNNAGVMFTPFGRTADGFELQIGVNHLGHVELTRRLGPLLRAAEAPRVVVLSSGGHVMGDVDLDDLNWESRRYDRFAAYGASKTANALHAVALDARLREHGGAAFAVDPGAAATALARHMSRADFSALRRHSAAAAAARGEESDGRLTFASPAEGAATQVWAAVSPDLAGLGGSYLTNLAVGAAAPYAADPARAERLQRLSEALVSARG
jgi:NAD(P)-dependent dehydrogenase (short-subunit alcohol dehydrogenase family)